MASLGSGKRDDAPQFSDTQNPYFHVHSCIMFRIALIILTLTACSGNYQRCPDGCLVSPLELTEDETRNNLETIAIQVLLEAMLF